MKGGVATNGFLAAVSTDGSFLVAEGTRCAIDGRVVLRSYNLVTVLKEGAVLRYSAAQPGTKSLAAGMKVRSVVLNGTIVKGWKKESGTGMTTLPIPAGEGTIEVK